jgi:DNA transposition AAA+ family ATPase
MLIKPREPKHFVDLSATQAVGNAVLAALQLDYPSLVLGEAGTGKTTALVHHATEHNAIYCHASHASKTVRGMYELVLAAAGWSSKSTFTRDLGEVVYSRLDPWGQQRGRMLIVDEVQNLGLDALRELLNLQETCRLTMVLAGNDKRLAQTRSHDTALEQVTSRIGFRVRLPRPSAEDCRQLAEAFGVAETRALTALSAFGQGTSLRDLARILEIVTLGNSTVALRHVEQAVRSVHGHDAAALKLLEAA